LLRTPGESQLKNVARFDEDFLSMWLLAGLAPCLMAILLLEVATRLPGWWFWVGLGVVVAGFVTALVLAVRWLMARLKQRSERYLAFFGERVVAEFLEPLKVSGWRIFHDVPCETGREKFNIDHIAIGPGGVYAIETRTRPKGSAREGRDDYKVFYDGEQLNWPWGEDQHGVVPAMGNAKWLQNWLGQDDRSIDGSGSGAGPAGMVCRGARPGCPAGRESVLASRRSGGERHGGA